MGEEQAPDTSDFRAQMLIGGWVCHGHDDLALFAAERPENGVYYGWWDRTAADLEGSMIAYADGPYVRAPDYWALPGVTELRVLREEAFGDVVREAV